jgi:hypothetical protein
MSTLAQNKRHPATTNTNKCCSPDLTFCRRLVESSCLWIFICAYLYFSTASPALSFPVAAAIGAAVVPSPQPLRVCLSTQREPLARWPQTATDATRNSPCRRRFTLVLARRIALARPRKRPSSAPARHLKAAQAKATIHRALSTSLTSSKML